MRHNVKQEFHQSMDSLRFSARAKEDMTQMLINEMNKQKAPRRRGRRKLLLLSLAAAVLMMTLTGAAVFTRWSRSVTAQYPITEQQKQAAEKSGLSVMLEETKEAVPEASQVISTTDNGITITAVQTLVDKYRAKLVFRIEGFDLPEGENPSIEGGLVSINGIAPGVSWGASFYNGLTQQADETSTYADGSPLEYYPDGSIVLRQAAEDGSLEYIIDIAFPEEGTDTSHGGLGYMEHLGSEILIRFTNVGIQDGLEHVPMVAGDWTLKWILTGTEENLFLEPHAPIGTSGFTLVSAEITPISCILTMEGDAYSHPGYTGEYEYWIPTLHGILLTDGTFISSGHGVGSFGEISPGVHQSNTSILAVSPEDIQSLAFYNMEGEIGNDYIVPIR